ncbi:MAG: Maf family protein, partial [Brachybacterium sp.]|nr:Maf family protein [Brachybacterium sp.]
MSVAPEVWPDGADPLLLLASASAGRRSTLRGAGIEHAALPADLDEDAVLAGAADLSAAEQVLLLAREKASAVLTAVTEADEGGYIVLGCDSMLEVDGEIVGKPGT